MFDLIEATHPGIGKNLKTRTRHLLGSRNSPPGKDGTAPIAEGVVDVFLAYFSSAWLRAPDPAFRITEIPPEWSPRIEYRLYDAQGRKMQALMSEVLHGKKYVRLSLDQLRVFNNYLADAGFSISRMEAIKTAGSKAGRHLDYDILALPEHEGVWATFTDPERSGACQGHCRSGRA